jgi:hypothetical protein
MVDQLAKIQLAASRPSRRNSKLSSVPLLDLSGNRVNQALVCVRQSSSGPTMAESFAVEQN